MKRKLLLLSWLSLILVAGGTILAVKTTPARNSQVANPAPAATEPSVWVKVPDVPIERQPVRASRLSEGMTKKQVIEAMGKPSDVKVFPNSNSQIEILNYRQEPLVTKVSIIDGYLSGVTIELKAIATNHLPRFAQNITIGMSRSKLLKLMGKPLVRRSANLSTYKLEQFTYVKEGNLPVNVILQDERVEGINTGLENPGKITKVILPAETPLSKSLSDKDKVNSIRIGMNPQQVIAVFGEPTAVEFSEVQEQPVAHLVYRALNTNASTQFTFIDNVLTRFSFIPQSHISKTGHHR
jgi:outer membrane protein assembly factor BamE (lipoprotein component of BamABCDE complex)